MEHIFRLEDNRIFAVFGSGAIMIGNTIGEHDTVAVHLADSQVEHVIGQNTDEDMTWKEERKGEEIILSFSSVNSINVLMDALTDAKNSLEDLQNG